MCLGPVVFWCRSKLVLGQITGMGIEKGLLHSYGKYQLQDVSSHWCTLLIPGYWIFKLSWKNSLHWRTSQFCLRAWFFHNVIILCYYLMRKSRFIAFTTWLKAQTLQRASGCLCWAGFCCCPVPTGFLYASFHLTLIPDILAVLPWSLCPMFSLLHYCPPLHIANPVINFVFILSQGCFASSLINDNYNPSKVIHYASPFLLFQL